MAVHIAHFNLASMLSGPRCPFDQAELHDAGNDSTYTLHTMLMLAIKSSRAHELSSVESSNLDNPSRGTILELIKLHRAEGGRRPIRLGDQLSRLAQYYGRCFRTRL